MWLVTISQPLQQCNASLSSNRSEAGTPGTCQARPGYNQGITCSLSEIINNYSPTLSVSETFNVTFQFLETWINTLLEQFPLIIIRKTLLQQFLSAAGLVFQTYSWIFGIWNLQPCSLHNLQKLKIKFWELFVFSASQNISLSTEQFQLYRLSWSLCISGSKMTWLLSSLVRWIFSTPGWRWRTSLLYYEVRQAHTCSYCSFTNQQPLIGYKWENCKKRWMCQDTFYLKWRLHILHSLGWDTG